MHKIQEGNKLQKMNLQEKVKSFFPSLSVCIYYMMSSLSFCYIYFHKQFFNVTFYEQNTGGIYYILSLEAIKPNQFRLLIPYLYKAFKTVFFFVPDKAAFFIIIVVITFITLVIFYNILNVYFDNKKINQWLTFILFYPMLWQFMVLNQIFDFTDFANFFFIFVGYYCIIKNYNKTLLLFFTLGTFNHDSIGFLIVMYVLFNIKDIFKQKTIFYTIAMAAIFIIVKKVLETIFASNLGISFRLNYEYNYNQFFDMPMHIVVRNVFLTFGGLHLFVLYFFISGRWKKFNTKYLYITFTLILYVIIIFLIHTTFEARNYMTAIPFIMILFLLFFTTQKNSFLKPVKEIQRQ
ncbi:MAG: hypothetical protein EHM58_10065 [Ignavibacteriae bacterium]|nr:MAG: hypothetical protein EHM58_10065 [Ignavibacteriota bacterium]